MNHQLNPYNHLQASLEINEMMQRDSLEAQVEQGLKGQQEDIKRARAQRRVNAKDEVEKKHIEEEEENSESEDEQPPDEEGRGRHLDIKV